MNAVFEDQRKFWSKHALTSFWCWRMFLPSAWSLSLTMRPPVGIIVSPSRLLLFFDGGSFPTRHVEVVLVIFLEKSRYGQKILLHLNMTGLFNNNNVHRLAVLSILLVSSIHGKGNPSQIFFDDLWKLLTKYFLVLCNIFSRGRRARTSARSSVPQIHPSSLAWRRSLSITIVLIVMYKNGEMCDVIT